MFKRALFAIALALSTAFPAQCVRAAGDDVAGSSQKSVNSDLALLDQFRAVQLSLADAIAISERLHQGSRSASVKFELSASPGYKVLTVRSNEAWEDIVDANTGRATAGATLSLRELSDEDRSNIVELGSVRQNLSDAVRVAEKATSGKAMGGGLVKQNGRLNFVVVVLSGERLKEVMLEPPTTRRSLGTP
jgi:Peptidase propeptide and YPEB domain